MGTLIDENTTSQCGKILAYMKEHWSISQAEAISAFNCFRLAARIKDLESRGYVIRHDLIKDRNAEGRPVRYTRYTLMEEPAWATK